MAVAYNRDFLPNLFQDQCTLTISATKNSGDIYAVALMIEDRPKTAITLNGRHFSPQSVLSSVPLQVSFFFLPMVTRNILFTELMTKTNVLLSETKGRN